MDSCRRVSTHGHRAPSASASAKLFRYLCSSAWSSRSTEISFSSTDLGTVGGEKACV